jgi:uncharacterized protein YlbG (UPF0298 family)
MHGEIINAYIHFNKKAEGMKEFGRLTHRSKGYFKMQMCMWCKIGSSDRVL